MSDFDDHLDAYESLVERMEELVAGWDAEGPVEPFKRYQRETDLSRLGWRHEGTMMIRCPQCQNRMILRDMPPCPRCRGIGSIMCTKVDVRDGLI